MNNPDSEVLYIKKGRRYHVWGNALTHGERFDRDPMKVGAARLAYCPSPGYLRYSYDVQPDHAAFLAAAEIARFAMEEAITKAARFKPNTSGNYTKQQKDIIERFRQEMADAGGLLPDYWHSGSPAEIAQAGIDAVAKVMANVAMRNDTVATGADIG